MQCKIMRTQDEDGAEMLQGIAWSEDIAEHYGMSDSEAARMDFELKQTGRYWVDFRVCIWPVS